MKELWTYGAGRGRCAHARSKTTSKAAAAAVAVWRSRFSEKLSFAPSSVRSVRKKEKPLEKDKRERGEERRVNEVSGFSP